MAPHAFEFDVHYDGVFFYQPLRYENDIVLPLFIAKGDKFQDFHAALEKALRSAITRIYYVIPGNQLNDGLLRLSDDVDLHCMFDIAYCYGKIDIYVNHIADDAVNGYLVSLNRDVSDGDEEGSDGDAEGSDGDAEGNVGDVEVNQVVRDSEVHDNEVFADNEDLGDGEGPPQSVVRRLFQDHIEGGGLENTEQFVADSSDSDYVVDDSSDSESDTASVDHLSEGEDELIQVRMRRLTSKNKPKSARQPKLGACRQPKPYSSIDDPFDTVAEHDEFIEELTRKLKVEGEDGVDEDPFVKVEHVEKWPIHNTATPWRVKKPIVGERYENYKQFKECLTYYALANGFSIWYEKSTQNKVIARCGQRPPSIKDPSLGKQRKHKMFPAVAKGDECKCPWRCFARTMKVENSFQVVSLWDEHKCTRNFRFGSLINYKWIGKQFGTRIRAQPGIKLVEIADLVMRKYKYIVSANQCRAAKIYALSEYSKSIEEHYGMLRSYADELLTSNPGSTVKINVTRNPDEKVYFDRMYVCLNGLKEGWKRGCRRVVALDGCFLKKPCTGELLTAIGMDGNNHIYPIAWAQVNVENKNNWTWFLELLGDDLGLDGGTGVTLISDQHKGLIEAVKDVLPYAEHRQCARHIYEGFRKRWSGVHFRGLFWAASKASYPQLFERIMAKVVQIQFRYQFGLKTFHYQVLLKRLQGRRQWTKQ